MSLFHSPKHKLAAGIVAGVTLLGTAAGVATAATTSSTATVSPAVLSAAAALSKAPLTGYWKTADHAAVEFLRGAEWYTLDWDRGAVGSASATSLTVQRPDGTSVTFVINSTTKFHGVSSGSALQTGSRVRVISYDGTAIRITVPDNVGPFGG